MENKEGNNIENKMNTNYKSSDKKSNRLGDDRARKKKRKKEKAYDSSNVKFKLSKKKVLITIGIVLAALLLIIGIMAGTYIYKAEGNLATAALNMAADVLGEDDPIFVLVLGISEDIKPALTDTIILSGYNPDSQKAFMLSIPRDTFVGKSEEYAGGYDKINALYQKGSKDGKNPGAYKTMEAVEKLTGIDIDHYVIVKNSAIPAIVGAIGEIEFDVPIDMDYDDPTQDLHIHFKAGLQMIDANEAEELLRFRHNNDGTSYPLSYGDNDYGRMRTQREFIKAIANKLVQGNSLSKINDIATAVFNNIETDMKLSHMLGYAPSALKLNIDGIRMEQLPGASEKLNNLWFYKHNGIETYDLVNELLAELALDEKETKDVYTPTKRANTPSTKKKNTNTVTDNSTEEIDQENCSHYYTNEIVEEPTCEEPGERLLKCTRCGKEYTEMIEKLDHDYIEKKSTTGKTETITITCRNCDYSKTTTKNLEENKNEIKNEVVEDNTVKECSHSYIKKTITAATCSTSGTEKEVCSLCGETKAGSETTIPATGQHKFEDGKETCSNCSTKNPNYTPPAVEPEPEPQPEEPTPQPPAEETTPPVEQTPPVEEPAA